MFFTTDMRSHSPIHIHDHVAMEGAGGLISYLWVGGLSLKVTKMLSSKPFSLKSATLSTLWERK